MNNGICYIVGAGEKSGLAFKPFENDMVIAVDGGFGYLVEMGLEPDLVIGDFDSLGYIPEHKNVIRLKKEKDDTDMLSAVKEGMKEGYDTFYLYCGMGGRIDHTLANIQLLAYLSQNGKKGFLIDEKNILTAVTDGSIDFPSGHKGYISVFSYSEKCVGVYLKGLKYELDNSEITNTFPIGVSNEFTEESASISVKDGTLIVVFPNEK